MPFAALATLADRSIAIAHRHTGETLVRTACGANGPDMQSCANVCVCTNTNAAACETAISRREGNICAHVFTVHSSVRHIEFLVPC